MKALRFVPDGYGTGSNHLVVDGADATGERRYRAERLSQLAAQRPGKDDENRRRGMLPGDTTWWIAACER
jgi:hypothetical protein